MSLKDYEETKNSPNNATGNVGKTDDDCNCIGTTETTKTATGRRVGYVPRAIDSSKGHNGLNDAKECHSGDHGKETWIE